MLVVPIIISFLFKVGGVFLIKTSKAYKTGFEKRGPICINSINLSMSSRIISDS